MKVAYEARSYLPNNTPPPSAQETAEREPFAPFEELAATLELSKAAREEKEMAANPGGPSDKSGKLTRRLVTAAFQGEVQAIISEAYENLTEWLKAAMAGGEDAGKAFAAIRRLNRLIRRCQRKIGDLDKEDALRLKQARAEQKQQELRAKQIEQELRRRIYERKQREQRYLRDTREENRKPFGPQQSPAALQAKIAAIAQTLAQFTAPPPPAAAGSDLALSFGGVGGEAAVSVGGEVSGGEASAEA